MKLELLKVNIKEAGYSKETVIGQVQFALHSGELIGLIGPNGSGKSTTLKAILGMLPHVHGDIIFYNEEKNYVYIPEQPVFYDELTLWEHIELAAAAYHLPKKIFETRAKELLTLFHMTKYIHELPIKFSKGMQQKVMIILAFLIRPKVYVVDEPFIGLDPRATKTFLRLLDTVIEEGAGVLMSTHVLDTAEKICTSIILMSEGSIMAQGTLDEILEQCKMPNASLLDCFSYLLGDE